MHLSEAKLHDVNVLDLLIPEPGAFYVMDRGYVDFKRLFLLHRLGAFFVVRAKSNIKCRRRYSAAADQSKGVRCDQTIVLTGPKTRKRYPQPLRRVSYRDPQTGQRLDLLTNHFAVPADIVAELYRQRWQVELFFKWIKQHLRIQSFFGTSENAVKTQLWNAVAVYALVAIVKKRLNVPAELYTILQILSLTLFEKIPLIQLLTKTEHTLDNPHNRNQLNLFD